MIKDTWSSQKYKKFMTNPMIKGILSKIIWETSDTPNDKGHIYLVKIQETYDGAYFTQNIYYLFAHAVLLFCYRQQPFDELTMLVY